MNISHLKLFHFPATRSARALWALHEAVGDDFELAKVELYKGEQYSDAYRANNPNHNVPMLEITLEDGSVHHMLESVAMVEWLVDAHPEKELAPGPNLTLERADYLQMLQFGGSWMDMMLWQIRIHEHILPPDQKDERTVTRYREKFQLEVEPQLRRRLEKYPFICGERFSGADIVIGHNVTWAHLYQLCRDDIFKQYIDRLSEREAFRKAFADARNFSAELPENASSRNFSG